jgi:hypothetical protein
MEKVELDLNLNTLIQFRSEDFKFRVVLGVWYGRMSLTAFGDQPRPVCKVLFNQYLTPILRKSIAKTLGTKEPTKTSIDVQSFNRDSKVMEYSATVEIGRDKDGVCFIVIRDRNNKEGVAVHTTTDYIQVDGKALDKVTSSEVGLRAFDECLQKGNIGEVLTSYKFSKGPGNDAGAPQHTTGEEVPF